MTNSKQAAKRVRQNQQARARNKAARTAMKTAVKQVVRSESPEKARQALPLAMKRIDKAAKTNVIHKNTAARLKSQVTRAAQGAK
jgi:small subunit ribosomal protein S20